MENEKKNFYCIIEKNDFDFNYIYNLDYEDQKLDDNIDFKKWQILVLKKFGNNSKLFRCMKDKILFYAKYENCLLYPGFYIRCPICKKYICCFCSYSSNQSSFIKCCRRRAINILLFIDAPHFVNNEFNNPSNYKELLFPGFNLINIFIRINNILFCTIATKESKKDNIGKLEISDKVENEVFARCIYLIPFALIVPFFIINFYFIFFMIIISIPFNDYPLKYYYGLLDEI